MSQCGTGVTVTSLPAKADYAAQSKHPVTSHMARDRVGHDAVMDIQTLTSSPRNERGDGQVSHLLLTQGQFGSQHLCITWVECQSAASRPATGT